MKIKRADLYTDRSDNFYRNFNVSDNNSEPVTAQNVRRVFSRQLPAGTATWSNSLQIAPVKAVRPVYKVSVASRFCAGRSTFRAVASQVFSLNFHLTAVYTLVVTPKLIDVNQTHPTTGSFSVYPRRLHRQDMQRFLLATLFVLVILAIGLLFLRRIDHQRDRREIDQLLAYQPIELYEYQPEMVSAAPEAVQRFFNFAIKPGTPVLTVVEVEMEGTFSLGDKDQPNTVNFNATQVIASPYGFVWKMKGGSGPMRISGSDTAHWTRFWLNGILPVARTGGSIDHKRSAFGRYVAEALFWSPAALLPGQGVVWRQVSPNVIRVDVSHHDMSQTVDVTIGDDGRPLQVLFSRWSNANQAKEYQQQPFGGTLSEFSEFNGYRVPTKIEAGNFFGTDNYFAFFKAEVTALRYPLQPSFK